MKRLGIAMRDARWTWALVEHGWGAPRVISSGDVDAGAWDALPRAASVGLALPDRHAVVRRLRIGHPPSSRDALRRLLRWRLKDDLPFDSGSAPLDGVVEDEHAIVLAMEPASVADAERRAASAGRVERVTSVSIAAFNAIDSSADGDYVLVEPGTHATFSVRGGRIVEVKLRDGEATAAEGARVVAEDQPVAWAIAGATSLPARAAAAVGAAL